jgi:hypothetical protein
MSLLETMAPAIHEETAPMHGTNPCMLSLSLRRTARPWLVLLCFELCLELGAIATASLARAAGGPLDPLQPLSSDPWLGPIGPTALYASDEPAGGRRGLWFGVSAGVSRAAGEHERIFGLLELGLGLEEWAGAEGVAAIAATNDGDAELAADAALGLPDPSAAQRRLPLRRSLAPDPAPVPAAPSAPEGDGCSNPRSCDPTVIATLARAVVAEALRVQGGGVELRRLDGMAARSRASAGLPEVRLGAGTSRDESLRLTPTLADPARFTRDGGRDLWLEARLTWRLDGAIFARDEIAIMRLRAQQREEAARLTRGVLEALVAFERARLRLASTSAPPEEREAAVLVHFGAVAELDVLTDGWFSRQLARARGGTAGTAPAEAWP